MPIENSPKTLQGPKRDRILRELLECFDSWEGAARIIGNVRADDAREAIRGALEEIEERRQLELLRIP